MELPVEQFTERDWQTADDPGTVRFARVGLGWWTREEAIPAGEAPAAEGEASGEEGASGEDQ